MATAAAFPFILGERTDDPHLLHGRAHPTGEAGLNGRPAGAPLLVEPPDDAPLTELAALVERADAETVLLRMEGLPLAAMQRTSLAVLRRRADRRGKTLLLIADSREQRRLAASAGLDSITSQEARIRLAEAETLSDTSAAAEATPQRRRRRSAFDEAPSAAPVVEVRPERPLVTASLDEVDALLSAIDDPLQEAPAFELERPRSWLAQARHVIAPPENIFPDVSDHRDLSIAETVPMAAFAPYPSRHGTDAEAFGLEVDTYPARAGRGSAFPLVAFGSLAGALLLFVVAAVLPSAQVELTPTSQSWSVDFPLTVDPGTKKPDASHGRLPGRAISKELSDTAQAPATGKKIAPDAKASGEVVFINKTARVVAVPKGTTVLAGANRFLTQADVNVPPTTPAGSQQMVGMQRVAVQAAAGGTSGNVDRFQINRVDGPLSSSLDVRNDSAVRGGTERPITYVTADDRKKLQDTLFRSLSDRLNQQLKGQLPAGDKETAIPWSAENPAIVEATFSKNVDEEASSVSLTMKVRYGATVFSNDAYNSLVQQIAAGKLRSDKPGSQTLGSIAPQAPQVMGVEGGQARLAAHAHTTISARIDAGALRAGLSNKPLDQARSFLDAQPGLSSYRLSAWPSFLGRMPWLGWRIAVSTAAASAP